MIFYLDSYVICEQWQFYFFLPNQFNFYFFLLPIALSRTPSVVFFFPQCGVKKE